jgi:diacylglycerol kinase family enzyme
MSEVSSIAEVKIQAEPVRHVLIVANRCSGTGQPAHLFADLETRLIAGLDGCETRVETCIVSDHAQARTVAREFAESSRAPSAIIAAGGGGTLRAVIEGVWDGVGEQRLEAPERVEVGALRLGSGNVVAKQFGVPLDPLEAVGGLAASLRLGRTAPCSVMRCRIGKAGGKFDVRYGVTMCGLGQFGRTSGDLARWHRRLPRLRRFIAGRWGIENLNDLEYATAMMARTCWAALWPRACDQVELCVQGRTQRLRLLAGVVMNLPIKMLPFDPGVQIEEPALSFHYVPAVSPRASLGMLAPRRLATKVRSMRVACGEWLQVWFLDPGPVGFFLDEDPDLAFGGVSVEVAGLLPFIPCPEYFSRNKDGDNP